ncbi:hypothetical protein [Streptomyces sp. NPDC051636]|uniref:hypothetical protein n=1 Tax=Streptomyces sp. NPDC051636 TaxID=3365663 RepID=UPI00379CC990
MDRAAEAPFSSLSLPVQTGTSASAPDVMAAVQMVGRTYPSRTLPKLVPALEAPASWTPTGTTRSVPVRPKPTGKSGEPRPSAVS